MVPTGSRWAVAEARLASSAGVLPESLRAIMVLGGDAEDVPTEA